MFIELTRNYLDSKICLNTDSIIAVVPPNSNDKCTTVLTLEDGSYTVKNKYEDIIKFLNTVGV